jgi:hypothetical protein
MNSSYLNAIRSKTNYPTFRSFVRIAELLGYGLAVLSVVLGLISGEGRSIVIFVFIAIVVALVAKASHELSLMVADIADATIDAAGRDVVRGSFESVKGHCAYDGAEISAKTLSSTDDPIGVTPSTQTIQKPSRNPLRTESDCTTLLNSLGYRTTARGAGWVVREPLGGTVKIADLEALLEYAKSKQYQRV